MNLRPHRIEARERLRDAVDGRLDLLGVRAEDAIPDHERRAVVLVEVLRIDCMMHAMMARQVEEPIERTAELPHQLRVDPELIERRQRVHDREDQRGHAEQRERQVEGETRPRRERRLPQRHRQVVVLALVMDDVCRPQEVHLVTEAVPPVVEEVDADERDDPRQPRPAPREAREIDELRVACGPTRRSRAGMPPRRSGAPAR